MGCKHIPVSFSSARSETPCLTWKMPCPLVVLCSTKCLFLRRLAVPTSGIPFERVFFTDTAIIAGVSTLILFPQIQAIPLRAHGRPRGFLSITTLYFILVIPHCSSSPFFSADTAFSTILFPIVLGSNGSTLTVCSILHPPILPIFGHKNNPVGIRQYQRGVSRVKHSTAQIRRYSPESGGPGCFFSIAHLPTSDPKEQKIPADVGSLPGSSA